MLSRLASKVHKLLISAHRQTAVDHWRRLRLVGVDSVCTGHTCLSCMMMHPTYYPVWSVSPLERFTCWSVSVQPVGCLFVVCPSKDAFVWHLCVRPSGYPPLLLLLLWLLQVSLLVSRLSVCLTHNTPARMLFLLPAVALGTCFNSCSLLIGDERPPYCCPPHSSSSYSFTPWATAGREAHVRVSVCICVCVDDQ